MRVYSQQPSFDLERLLRERPFEALTLHERAEVLTEMSAEEYRRVREVALLAESYLGDGPSLPQPRPETQVQVRQRLRQRRRWTAQVKQLIDYRLPAWQAAAAALLLVVTLQLATGPKTGLDRSLAPSAMIADSTRIHHDSAVIQVLDPHEDSLPITMARQVDTL